MFSVEYVEEKRTDLKYLFSGVKNTCINDIRILRSYIICHNNEKRKRDFRQKRTENSESHKEE